VVATIGASSDSAKHFTLWVAYHHHSQEGWDLANVYQLQSFEKNYTK
jgi:hypothetical protein